MKKFCLFSLILILTGCISVKETGQPAATEEEFPEITAETPISTNSAYKFYTLALSTDGSYLAAGCIVEEERALKLFNLAVTPISCLSLEGHTDVVYCIAFDPAGKYLATGSYDKTVKVWDIKTGALVYDLTEAADSINAVAIDPTGQLLATAGADKLIRLYNLETGRLLKTLKGHTDSILILTFNLEKKLLLSAGRDNQVKAWDLTSGVLLKTFSGHKDWILGLAMDRAGKKFYSADKDGILKTWDYASGRMISEQKQGSSGINLVCLDPLDRELLSADNSGNVAFRDPETGYAGSTLECHADSIEGFAVDATGKYFATASLDKTIKLWTLKEHTLLTTIQCYTDDTFSATANQAPAVQPLEGALALWKKTYATTRPAVSDMLRTYGTQLVSEDRELAGNTYAAIEFSITTPSCLHIAFTTFDAPTPFTALLTRNQYDTWRAGNASFPDNLAYSTQLYSGNIWYKLETTGDYVEILWNKENSVTHVNYTASCVPVAELKKFPLDGMAMHIVFEAFNHPVIYGYYQNRLEVAPNNLFGDFDFSGLPYAEDDYDYYDIAFPLAKNSPMQVKIYSPGIAVKADLYNSIYNQNKQELTLLETIDWSDGIDKKLETQLGSDTVFMRIKVKEFARLIIELE